MTISIVEGALRFDFDHVRMVRKWDNSSAYVRGIQRLATSSAADFLVILQADNAPVILEATDYRGHRLGVGGSKDALDSGKLIDEVVSKIRDSIAGLLWACARGLDAPTEFKVEDFAEHIVNRHDGLPKLLVVLWLEDDKLGPHEAAVLGEKIVSKLKRWLRPKVLVTNKRLEAATKQPLHWLSVV